MPTHSRQAATSPFFHFGREVRLAMRFSYSYPAGHRHHTSTRIFGVAFSGVSPPLRSCNHVAATCGYVSASETPPFPARAPYPVNDPAPGSNAGREGLQDADSAALSDHSRTAEWSVVIRSLSQERRT